MYGTIFNGNPRCIALTFDDERCKRAAERGHLRCSTHKNQLRPEERYYIVCQYKTGRPPQNDNQRRRYTNSWKFDVIYSRPFVTYAQAMRFLHLSWGMFNRDRKYGKFNSARVELKEKAFK